MRAAFKKAALKKKNLYYLYDLRVVVRLGPLKFYVMECSDFLFKARLWLINVVEKDFTPIS